MSDSPPIAEPPYSRQDLTAGILHFGVGNFHRSHQAMYLDRLLRLGQAHDWGIIGVGILPQDAQMGEALRAQDFAYTLVELDAGGSRTATCIGSIIDFVHAPSEPERMKSLLASPDIRIVTLTITEGGYNVSDTTGEFDQDDPLVRSDLTAEHPQTVFGLLTAGLRARREAGIPPFTIASCDNIAGNGDVARDAVVAFARLAHGEAFAEWIRREVAFPNSMVDRITPVTTDAERALVHDEFGVDDARPVTCEPFTQWVFENRFPSGRPEWERVGAQSVDDVAPYELMKLRLLNGSHQAMAYLGLLRGHVHVHEAMGDPVVADLVRRYMHDEAASTLDPVPGIDLDDYMETLFLRFGNPHIRDTLARLATNGSDRLPKFLVPVARKRSRAGLASPAAAAVLASWVVRTRGLIDEGTDPDDRQAPRLREVIKSIDEDPAAVLAHRDWFGDLADDARFVEDFRQAFEAWERR